MFFSKLCAFFSLLFLVPPLGGNIDSYLVEDMANIDTLPKRFRTGPNCISGSGQFSKKSFKKILETLGSPKPLYLVDLREESHGFLDGAAISWYYPENKGNLNRSLDEIVSIEKKLLAGLKGNAETEEAAFPQVHYIRIPVLDHNGPTALILERFLHFFSTLPKGSWIHFHCRRGAGRTTLFMTLTEILRKGDTMTLEEIVEEQKRIGGIDLLATLSKENWKHSSNETRKAFLRAFYEKNRCLGASCKTPFNHQE